MGEQAVCECLTYVRETHSLFPNEKREQNNIIIVDGLITGEALSHIPEHTSATSNSSAQLIQVIVKALSSIYLFSVYI